MKHGLVVMLGLAVASSLPATESTNTWYLRGPYGGYADAVAIDPATGDVVAGGQSGVFRYPSGGTPDSWSYSNVGAPTPFASEFAIASTTLYQNSGGYVARWDVIDTSNGDKAWVEKNAAPLPAGQTSSISTSAAATQRIYATSYGAGVYRSDNRGDSWVATASQPAELDLMLVRASPTNADLILAAGDSDSNGVAHLYRSTDGGATWSVAILAAGSASLAFQFLDAAQDPANPNRWLLLASPNNNSYESWYQTDGGGGSVIYDSTDAGASWAPLAADALKIAANESETAEAHTLLFDHAANGTVYIGATWGIFKSTDGGANWAYSSTGLLTMGARDSGAIASDDVERIAQGQGGTLYATGFGGGVYFSGDGSTWTTHTNGYNGLDIRKLAFQPGNTGVVLAASDTNVAGGAYRSTDGGTTWTSSSTGLASDILRGLAFSTSNPAEVLAAGFPQQDVGGAFSKGLWESGDGGVNWSALSLNDNALQSAQWRSVVIDPQNPNHIVLDGGNRVVVGDFIASAWQWTAPLSDCTGGVANAGLPVDCVHNPGVLGGDVQALGLVAGPQPPAVGTGTRYYLALDRIDDYANPAPGGYVGGVYYSDDGGLHWTLSTGMPNLPDDAPYYFDISPTPGTLFVTKLQNDSQHRTGGVFKSTDYGVTWNDASTGLTTKVMWNVAVDPTDANTLYAVASFQGPTAPGGVFRSADGGAYWVPYDRGLRNLGLLAVAIDPTNHNHILVGGVEGIYEMNYLTDTDQDGIPDIEEQAAPNDGDANNDGIPDYQQANVASTPLGFTITAPTKASTSAATASDYVAVEIDHTAPSTGICQFVSDLAALPTSEIPLATNMQQLAPAIRFVLPDCLAATVKIRYSALTSYTVPVFGSYSPAVPGDSTTFRWGLFDAAAAGVDGSGVWTVHLDQNAYGNVYAPGSGSILFQGAPGKDSIFGNGFD